LPDKIISLNSDRPIGSLRCCFRWRLRLIGIHCMIKHTLILSALVAASAAAASAQTNYVTVTNVVTVTVTNFVVVTNAVMPAISVTAPVVMKPGKTNAWNQSISAGLTLARGNTDLTMVNADYNATKKTPNDEYDLAGGIGYGEQDSKQTVDNYKASLQWNHLFTKRFYAYLRTDGLRDYIADVDYRFTVGPGAGYYLLKQTNTTLSFETGINYEAQDLGGKEDSFANIRLADKFNAHARFWQSIELIPQADQIGNYIVNFEIGAEAAFTKALSLKTYLDDNYDNRPALDHVKNDIKLVAGIAYKF
jgi:putative salt-induced outer membrane protein YdiY